MLNTTISQVHTIQETFLILLIWYEFYLCNFWATQFLWFKTTFFGGCYILQICILEILQILILQINAHIRSFSYRSPIKPIVLSWINKIQEIWENEKICKLSITQ